VKPLIHDVEFDMFLGDKAFDADWLRTELNERGAVVVIPPKSNRNAARQTGSESPAIKIGKLSGARDDGRA
jgi:hypothetical protein